MAAEQLTGRTCACGCQESIDGMHQTALYTRECKLRIHNERKRLCNIKRLARLKASRVTPAQCKTCWGLPWARGPHRVQNDRSEKKVGDAYWRCIECREPYEPEPKPEHGVMLSSSGGTAVRHGVLYGAETARPGEGLIGEGVASSRAKGKR